MRLHALSVIRAAAGRHARARAFIAGVVIMMALVFGLVVRPWTDRAGEQASAETYRYRFERAPRGAVRQALEAEIAFTWISDLTAHGEPRGCVECLYGCGFARDDDAVEVHTQWVRHQTSPFSSLSTPR